MKNIGIIGVGYWGRNYVNVFGGMDDVDLGWVCNRRNRVLDVELPDETKFCCDYRDVLSDELVDAVVVSTPFESHYQIVKDALMADKDVLVEKPMTYSSDEALELCKLARERSRVLMVGHIFLYNEAIDEVKGMVDGGDLGNLLYFESRRMGTVNNRGDYNAMWCLAPHDVSIVNHLVGELPVSVYAEGKGWIEEGVEDITHMKLRFANGVVADIFSGWAYPKKVRKSVIVGDKGIAMFDDMAEHKVETFDAEGRGPLRSLDCSDGKSPLERQCEDFVSCIEKRDRPLSSGVNGYENVRVLEAAQKSLVSGKTIYLD